MITTGPLSRIVSWAVAMPCPSGASSLSIRYALSDRLCWVRKIFTRVRPSLSLTYPPLGRMVTAGPGGQRLRAAASRSDTGKRETGGCPLHVGGASQSQGSGNCQPFNHPAPLSPYSKIGWITQKWGSIEDGYFSGSKRAVGPRPVVQLGVLGIRWCHGGRMADMAKGIFTEAPRA